MKFNNPAINGALIGAPIGLTIAWYWFNTWDWYHNYVIGAFTNPYLLGFGALLGLGYGIWEDSQK